MKGNKRLIEMKKFPSIEQFRNVVKVVRLQHDYQGKDELGAPIYQHLSDYPTLWFQGTVKLHGTNAGIVKYKDRIEFQSRERILNLGSDNAGFMTTMSGYNLDFMFDGIEFNDYIAIYGEWCGSSIQKGVAICELPKMFVVFGLLVDDEWRNCADVPVNEEYRIFNINQFPTFGVEIDFNNPEAIQNKLIELTLAVEEECPVGKHFGKRGIGEGLVLTCNERPELRFKSKGEKHSSSKVKVLNSVDTEQIVTIKEFVEYAVTENRLQQGLTTLKETFAEPTQKETRDFIQWIMRDILKEETDTIVANGLEFKKYSGAIATKARQWYLNNI